jgi:hypothetical protein
VSAPGALKRAPGIKKESPAMSFKTYISSLCAGVVMKVAKLFIIGVIPIFLSGLYAYLSE